MSRHCRTTQLSGKLSMKHKEILLDIVCQNAPATGKLLKDGGLCQEWQGGLPSLDEDSSLKRHTELYTKPKVSMCAPREDWGGWASHSSCTGNGSCWQGVTFRFEVQCFIWHAAALAKRDLHRERQPSARPKAAPERHHRSSCSATPTTSLLEQTSKLVHPFSDCTAKDSLRLRGQRDG